MKVFSYNIHKGIGGRDRRYRIDRVIRVIEAANAELICLQEVDRGVRRSHFDDQPALLAKHFHAAGVLYQLNVHLKTGGYGNLLLSRWPLRTHHQISLRRGWRKPRGAQMAVVETPKGPVHLVNWHLGLAERERHWQVNHLLEHRLYRESAHHPTLIIGDSNDWRNTLARGPFRRNGLHQVTAPPSRFRSFPAFMPLGALDKAFASPNIIIREARVLHSRLARQASDHLPLCVEIDLA